MNEPRPIHSASVLIVSVIVAVGILSSLDKPTRLGWAAGSYPTDAYQVENGTYKWQQSVNESLSGLGSLGFETVNGNITLGPRDDDQDTILVTAAIEIKRRFWGTRQSILHAKEKTGIAMIRDGDNLVFRIENPKLRFYSPVTIVAHLDIRLPKGCGIPLHAKTVNGRVGAASLACPMQVETVNGKIELNECDGSLQGNTVNGSIQVENPHQAFHLGTVNGSIHVTVKEANAEECSLSTVNGHVTVALPEGAGKNLELSTVNGRARIHEKHAFQGEWKKNQAKGTINGGGAPVTLSAVNGSVSIE